LWDTHLSSPAATIGRQENTPLKGFTGPDHPSQSSWRNGAGIRSQLKAAAGKWSTLLQFVHFASQTASPPIGRNYLTRTGYFAAIFALTLLDQPRNIAMTDAPRFPIVGVGASAGGIPALEGFFAGLPANCGLAVVVVTHLSPDRESLLHEVISRYTAMPVAVAQHDQRVEINHVYVMPQNAILFIEQGVLKIRVPDALHRERKPIDIFFASLAKDQGEYAVGVILSGGDGDGTLGAKAIKEAGGLTLAQTSDGSGPRHPDMPQSAISSGVIDISVPVEEMGRRLVAFARNFDVLEGIARNNGDHEEEALDSARLEICAVLTSHTGHDFSGYKTKTFFRRVRRRMQVNQLTSIAGYLEQLKRDANEVISLFRDLLINVTTFFRDTEAFEILEESVVPKLFEGKTAGDAVRIWVPGCATGEEVFSLAILMREYMDQHSVNPKVQIFATDIDEPALAVARLARYPENLLEGLTRERRDKFFKSDGAGFALNAEVRELCIFSPHNLIRDPPFSRMDMVSCRNLLIYFGAEIQKQVIPTFHYALKPGGYLFLGSSESIGAHSHLFAPVDKKLRIFQAREHPTQMPRLPSTIGHDRSITFADVRSTATRDTTTALRQAAETRILERFAPAHVIVTGDGDILYYSAGTGRFLEAPQGVPSRQLLTVARRGLRLDLRSALRQAAETRRPAVRESITVERDDGQVQSVTVTVEPLSEQANPEPFYLVVFAPQGPVQSAIDSTGFDRVGAEAEQELREIKERLQSTIEEYETALEELKSSNEELVSVNEEAQSSNEELEASKEETQSLNEELNTINAELHSKIEELDRANADLRNLFESTQIATIFLDRNLVIRTYTPAAAAFFNLRPADVGRPLTELASELDYPELKDHISRVFDTGEPLDHHLAKDRHGKHYLVRLIPYRRSGSMPDGVVVTLVDVTLLAEAERHQQVLISELNHRVKNMLAVVTTIADRTFESAPSHEAFSQAFNGRLNAMSRAYGALSRENWKEASLHELITQELSPFGGHAFVIEGPDIRLKPQQALSIAMVLHELATNAAKHGALSINGGRIHASCEPSDANLVLTWTERGGPPVAPTDKKGFGFELLEGEIDYRLKGKLETKFDPAGLVVRIEIPAK
jgi:two-component system CheB/CheR fusion protein